jgi:hypothetical protein
LDHFRVAAELDGANRVVSRFIRALGQNAPDYMIRDRAIYQIVKDRTGSPWLILNASTGGARIWKVRSSEGLSGSLDTERPKGASESSKIMPFEAKAGIQVMGPAWMWAKP